MKSTIHRILFCWDWPLALVHTVCLGFFIPRDLSYTLANRIFGAGMTVLSVVFSMFFTALAVLIAAGDNEFVQFLEKNGYYDRILWPYKVTLVLLFVSLVASISLFIATAPWTDTKNAPTFPKGYLEIFGFISFYSLFAAIHTTIGTLRYAEFREKFLDISDE